MYGNKAQNDTLLKTHLVVDSISIYSSNCTDCLLPFVLSLFCMLRLGENNRKEVRQKADYLLPTQWRGFLVISRLSGGLLSRKEKLLLHPNLPAVGNNTSKIIIIQAASPLVESQNAHAFWKVRIKGPQPFRAHGQLLNSGIRWWVWPQNGHVGDRTYHTERESPCAGDKRNTF